MSLAATALSTRSPVNNKVRSISGLWHKFAVGRPIGRFIGMTHLNLGKPDAVHESTTRSVISRPHASQIFTWLGSQRLLAHGRSCHTSVASNASCQRGVQLSRGDRKMASPLFRFDVSVVGTCNKNSSNQSRACKCCSDEVALRTVGCNKLSTLRAILPVHCSIFADVLVVALSTEIWTLRF